MKIMPCFPAYKKILKSARFALCAFCLALPTCLFAGYERMDIDGIEFVYRLPENIGQNTRIMVLFGGRNCPGDKALDTFNFSELADKYSLVLLSPSFRDNDYWEPEAWSGKVLKSALKSLTKKYKLKQQKLLFYGYSAGGQCSNLFYNYMPSRVEAWGLHACGVYPESPVKRGVKAFITCGQKDALRVVISSIFIRNYRENGGKIIWKSYKGGHELNKEALEFARQFFIDILENRKVQFVGKDDSGIALPINKVSEIDLKYRNYLTSENLKKLWETP